MALTRYAVIHSTSEQITNYLPGNYKIAHVGNGKTVIEGVDSCGWTLDGYVLPRLASGLHFGEELSSLEAGILIHSIDLDGVKSTRED